MSSDARRKERKRLKREKKKAAVRRELSDSPYKRIGAAGHTEACYINADWQEQGLASIYVLRRAPGGSLAMAGFLIDTFCSGLKDAWGHLEIRREEFDRHLKHTGEHMDLERVDPALIRRLVAGAIRFARQNGFRLPAHYDRWVALAGGCDDVTHADLSSFGKDGKLMWIGPLEDLRHRLIGCTLEQFLSRPDVDYLAQTTAPEFDDEYDDDDTDEDYEDREQALDSPPASPPAAT